MQGEREPSPTRDIRQRKQQREKWPNQFTTSDRFITFVKAFPSHLDEQRQTRLTANGEVRLTVNHLHDDDVVDNHVDCQFRRRIVQRVLFLFSKLVCDAADYDGDGSVVVAARRFSRRRLRNSTRNLNVKSD